MVSPEPPPQPRSHEWWGRLPGPAPRASSTRLGPTTAPSSHPSQLERTILSIRRRLQAIPPATRYSLIGVSAILAELKTLNVQPLPRADHRSRVAANGLTVPRVRLAPLLPRQKYPGPQARASNQLHEVDLVGPVYLTAVRTAITSGWARTPSTVPS